jgi:iron complex transport system ATP-binding protein
MVESAVALSAHAITVNVGSRCLVRDLSLSFRGGELVALLGRNGSGKTLTLHTLAGLRSAESGDVLVNGTPVQNLARKSVAQSLGLLTQDPEEGFTTTALESVLIGRYPHLKFLQWESAEDRRIADEALNRVGLGEFSHRLTDTLSGGERRRVALASLLAQQPSVYLLDEPTNHLDPHHQLAMLGLFKELTRNGATVIASLHDPTLAARFADRVLLLFGDGQWRAGTVNEVLTADTLSELYLTPMHEMMANGHKAFVFA